MRIFSYVLVMRHEHIYLSLQLPLQVFHTIQKQKKKYSFTTMELFKWTDKEKYGGDERQ
jgi:hypothetical protein